MVSGNNLNSETQLESIIDSSLSIERKGSSVYLHAARVILTLLSTAGSRSAAHHLINELILSCTDEQLYLIESAINEVNSTFSMVSTIDEILVQGTLEGSTSSVRWSSRLVELLEDAEEEKKLDLVQDIYYLSRYELFKKARAKGVKIFQHVDSFKSINRKAKQVFLNLSVSQISASSRTSEFFSAERISRIFYVISSPFSGKDNTHYNVICNIANALQTSLPDIEQSLLITCEDCVSTALIDIRVPSSQTYDTIREKWINIAGNKGDVYPKLNKVGAKNKYLVMEELWNLLLKKNPDVVVFLGGNYQSDIFRIKCHQYFPTFYAPTNISNAPDKFIDKIAVTKQSYAERLISKKFKDEKFIFVPSIVNVFEDAGEYDGDFARSIDDVVFVTAIGTWRLSAAFRAYTEDEITTICNFFETHKKFRWVLVGEPNESSITGIDIRLKELTTEKRLVFISYTDKLRGLYRMCDGVFVIPGVSGGNQAVAAAMLEHLPVIAGYDSDSSSLVPAVGIYRGFSQAFGLLSAMVSDKKARQSHALCCYEKILTHSPSKVAESWGAAIKAASDSGKMRLKNSSKLR